MIQYCHGFGHNSPLPVGSRYSGFDNLSVHVCVQKALCLACVRMALLDRLQQYKDKQAETQFKVAYNNATSALKIFK